MQNMFDLTGKVAVITGGGGALGSAIADGLAGAGVKVAVLGRTFSSLEAVVDRIGKKGGIAKAVQADVLNEASLKDALDTLVEDWAKIDILVNCAGGNMKGATIMPDQTFFDLSIADFDKVTALNLKGSIVPILVFGKSMAERGEGCIINVSSMAAQRPLTRVFGYAASKAAIDNMTKWLAVEMAQKFGEKIRVNAIAPGFFVGEQNRSLLYDEDGQLSARGKTIIDHTPMKRFGNAEELCGVVNWLCGPAASFVTGIVIPIDGGFSAFSGI
jgi:NAD(P)-dependent dehydrogenase (short-subunit alcohol dehydrogenase family)